MEKSNGQRIYKTIMLVVIVAMIASMASAYGVYQYLNSSNGIHVQKSVNSTNLKGLELTLSEFRSELEKKYVGQINDEELVEGAIKGYINALGDPYTTYYTPKEMAALMEETNGNYVGIGVYMTLDKEKNAIVIIKPMEDSPAEKAGILEGDIIIKVNGESYTGEQMEAASNKIKGEEGTNVTIEILRGTETKEFTITRKRILISHITAKVLEDNIGYIAISDFDGGSATEFENKYKQLAEKGIEKLVIDIRNNGGGIVDESINMLDLMTEKDSILLITKDKKETEEITKAKRNPIINMPIVLLVNEYSASASEILAGALQDNEKATLVGKKTYGKGVIQELHQLSDGSGLKITTNEYYTPNRHEINKIGIKPDVEVELTKDEDTQLQKAIEVLKEK